MRASSTDFHRSWAEIDLQALQHNFRHVREWAGADSGIIAVVKANAYGHGLIPVVHELRDQACAFGVAGLEEALTVRRTAPNAEVLILGPAAPEERLRIVREKFLPSISSLDEARAFASLAGADGIDLEAVVDTGMGRIGIPEPNALEVLGKIARIPGVRLHGISTHFPCADSDDAFTLAQIKRIEEIGQLLAKQEQFDGFLHYLNSAGLLRHGPSRPGRRLRIGLLLYGVSPLGDDHPGLEPVMTWKTVVTLVRDLPKHHGVSYGRTYITPGPARVATLAVGYADGYSRHFSSTGASVLIQGTRCPVLGRVTMDQIVVDVTALDNVAPGEEAVLLGRQSGQQISANELAALEGGIPWELLCRVGHRVARRHVHPTILLADGS